MSIHVRSTSTTTRAVNHGASAFRFWTALFMSVLTGGTFTLAYLTPPRSGPFCRMSTCIGAPYTDIAAFFPRDYLWMYPATLLALVFVVCLACIHDYAAAERKLFSVIGLTFAAMGSALIVLDYFIQLTVIQPSLLNSETEGLGLISQYNPHGIFIALEAVGYLLMSVAFIFAAAVFTGCTRVERALRWLLRSGFVLSSGGLIVFALTYGHALEYRYEVYVISIVWLVLIMSGGLLAVIFRRAARNQA